MGIVYMAAVGAGALGAYYMTFKTDFRWLSGASPVGLATAWVTTTGWHSWRSRSPSSSQHKEWMLC
jgi:hypothetical protein